MKANVVAFIGQHPDGKVGLNQQPFQVVFDKPFAGNELITHLLGTGKVVQVLTPAIKVTVADEKGQNQRQAYAHWLKVFSQRPEWYVEREFFNKDVEWLEIEFPNGPLSPPATR